MVDSNLQRENILPSERAKAYQMKLDAIILLIMFLYGVMIFLLPIWGQMQEVKEDEQEFTVMLEQLTPTVADTADVVPEHDDSVVEAASETAPPDMSVMLPVLVVMPQSAEPDAASDDSESSPVPDEQPEKQKEQRTKRTIR